MTQTLTSKNPIPYTKFSYNKDARTFMISADNIERHFGTTRLDYCTDREKAGFWFKGKNHHAFFNYVFDIKDNDGKVVGALFHTSVGGVMYYLEVVI